MKDERDGRIVPLTVDEDVDVNVLDRADCSRARSSAPTIEATGAFCLGTGAPGTEATGAGALGSGISPSILPRSLASNCGENLDCRPAFSL